MKDEEMAEEYKEKHICSTCADIQDCGNDCPFSRCGVQAFLAGLKAGRPQWHDLRENPNDLPKRDKTFVTDVSVTVVVYPLEFAVYYFFDKKWYSNGKEVKVDRWCEIPTFDKE